MGYREKKKKEKKYRKTKLKAQAFSKSEDLKNAQSQNAKRSTQLGGFLPLQAKMKYIFLYQ